MNCLENYSLNKNEATSFILHYEVINAFIYITYGDGRIDVKSYSIEEEKRILKKMKNQVLNSKNFLVDLNYKFEIFFKLLLDEILLLTMFIVTIISIGLPYFSTIIGLLIFPIIMGFTSYKLNGYKKLRKDIKKNLLFVKNEDNLNIIIRNSPEVINKLRDKVLTKSSNKFVFTLNTIDRIKYEELQQIYDSVDKTINNRHKALNKKDIRK